jgi:hypothetical protein
MAELERGNAKLALPTDNGTHWQSRSTNQLTARPQPCHFQQAIHFNVSRKNATTKQSVRVRDTRGREQGVGLKINVEMATEGNE